LRIASITIISFDPDKSNSITFSQAENDNQTNKIANIGSNLFKQI